MHVDRFFTLGPGAVFERNAVFTNREGHIAAFRSRLLEHDATRWTPSQLQDFRRPAWNALVFHGEGGIGKSTLTRHLTSLAREPDSPQSRRAAAVVDFADVSALSFETLLLRVRAGLGPLARSWPSFDVGFAVYWARKHPGEPLAAVPATRQGQGGRGAREQVGDQILQAADQFLGGFGVLGLGYQASAAAGRRARKAVRLKRLREDFPPLSYLLDEPDPDRMLGYLPILLARDLEAARSKGRGASALCVLDTFETVHALPPEHGGTEDLVSRLVYLMPNVLFLVAGRRPLAWHEPVRARGLTYGGADRWPGLASGGGDQFRVTGLDEEAADGYLRSTLTVDQQPVIPVEIRRRIIAGSAGSPHYLDLAVGLFERTAAAEPSAPVGEEAFGHPFPDLVLRVMRDLSVEERDLLRAAALLDAFDVGTLAAAVPTVRGRQIEEFVRRSFVHAATDGAWPPYRLHESLRRTVRECDAYTADGWTHDERRRAAEAAIAHLGEVTSRVWSTPRGEDAAARVAPAVLLALRAAHEHGLTPPVLGDMTFTLRELGHWQEMASLPAFGDCAELDRLTHVARLTARTGDNASARYAKMRDRVTTAGATPYGDFLQHELASLAFSVGRLQEAYDGYHALAGGTDGIAASARLGLAGIALRHSNYTEVMARLSAIGDSFQAPIDDMLGHVHLHNGRFDDAAAVFQRAYEHAREVRAVLWAARATRHLVLSLMWQRPDDALRILPQARQLNEMLGDHIGLAQCDMAEGLSLTLTGHVVAGRTRINRARERFTNVGAAFELLPVAPVSVLAYLVAGHPGRARVEAEHLQGVTVAGRPPGPPVWNALAAAWTGIASDALDSIAWLDPHDARICWQFPATQAIPAAQATPTGDTP